MMSVRTFAGLQAVAPNPTLHAPFVRVLGDIDYCARTSSRPPRSPTDRGVPAAPRRRPANDDGWINCPDRVRWALRCRGVRRGASGAARLTPSRAERGWDHARFDGCVESLHVSVPVACREVEPAGVHARQSAHEFEVLSRLGFRGARFEHEAFNLAVGHDGVMRDVPLTEHEQEVRQVLGLTCKRWFAVTTDVRSRAPFDGKPVGRSR